MGSMATQLGDSRTQLGDRRTQLGDRRIQLNNSRTQLEDSRANSSEEVRQLNVMIREPKTARIFRTDIPRSSRSSRSDTPPGARLITPVPIIRTEVDTPSGSQNSVTDSDSVRSSRHNHMTTNKYYSSSPAHSDRKTGAIQSSSRNTYDSMSTGEAVHVAYRKALQRKKHSN